MSSGASRDAVLLVALGTPKSPTPRDVRRYLAEFLSDPRVVQIPRLAWWPILYGLILTTRPKVSAKKYALIWTAEGSPLKVHTERQAKLLRGYLGEQMRERMRPVPHVDYAMRYGKPSIGEALDRLRATGCTRVVVIPLYPQYAESTTASVDDALRPHRRKLELTLVRHFHDHPGYIKALAAQLRHHQEKHGPIERLLMSFHGLPQRAVDAGDPYRREAEETARLLAREFGIPSDRWQLSFQSRFGRAAWLQPYTAATLERLGREGVPRIDVVCPGFVSDCLETLEEIGIEGRKSFLQAGGREFHLVPCLNERDDWIRALADLASAELDARPR